MKGTLLLARIAFLLYLAFRRSDVTEASYQALKAQKLEAVDDWL